MFIIQVRMSCSLKRVVLFENVDLKEYYLCFWIVLHYPECLYPERNHLEFHCFECEENG